MNTDVKKMVGLDIPQILNSLSSWLTEDWIYTEDLDRSNEECNYILQIETYGRKIYAQEELANILKLGHSLILIIISAPKSPAKPTLVNVWSI